MEITEEVVVRIVKVTFLSWSAQNPSFLSLSDRKTGISTQITLKPLSANPLMINQQALIKNAQLILSRYLLLPPTEVKVTLHPEDVKFTLGFLFILCSS